MTRKDSVELADLPPSTKLVYKMLEYTGESTQQQITEESLLSPRTVPYGLQRLEEIGAITEEVYFPDARQSVYELAYNPSSSRQSK